MDHPQSQHKIPLITPFSIGPANSFLAPFYREAPSECCLSLRCVIIHLKFSFEPYQTTFPCWSKPDFIRVPVWNPKVSSVMPSLDSQWHFKQCSVPFTVERFFPWLLGRHTHPGFPFTLLLTASRFLLLMHLISVTSAVILPGHSIPGLLFFCSSLCGVCLFPLSASTLSHWFFNSSPTGRFYLEVILASQT